MPPPPSDPSPSPSLSPAPEPERDADPQPSPSASKSPASSRSSSAQQQSRDEDLRLVADCLGTGKPDAFEKLFQKYREKVYRVVYGYVYDKEDALDITQEAFIKAFRNLKSFQQKSGFYTWLTQIAINLAIDFRRKKKRKKIVTLEEYMEGRDRGPGGAVHEGSVIASGAAPGRGGPSAAPDPAEKLEEKEFREQYFEALEQLTEKHRTVFLLHTVDGMAYKEIADALEISIGTVMSRLHYARKRLQDLLGEYLG